MKMLYGLRARLAGRLEHDAVALPLRAEDAAWVIAHLGDDGHAWLTIEDNLCTEVVRASRFGHVVSIERARDGTRAHDFPAGSCVDGRLTAAAVKELICHYDCCAETGPKEN